MDGHPVRLVDRLASATTALEGPGGRVEGTWAAQPPRWTFPGRAEWQDVHVTSCRYHGRQIGAVWMHPPEKGWVVVTMPIPPTATFVLVSAGLVDGAPEFGRAEVHVDLRAGSGGAPTRLTFANEPGRFGRTVRLPPDHGGRLELAVGAANNGRRHFCLDATVW